MSQPRAIVPDKGIRPGLSATAIAANRFVVDDSAANGIDAVKYPAGTGVLAVGVTMEAILVPVVGNDLSNPANRGDIQVEGRAVVEAGAAITSGVPVAVQTGTGKVLTAVSTNIVMGVARTAAAGDGSLIEVELAGQGGGYVLP